MAGKQTLPGDAYRRGISAHVAILLSQTPHAAPRLSPITVPKRLNKGKSALLDFVNGLLRQITPKYFGVPPPPHFG